MPEDWEYGNLEEEDYPILVKRKALFGKEQILENYTLEDFCIFVFEGDKEKSKEKP